MSDLTKNVSVVICTKNVEKYIKDCIESILDNYPKEILIVDGNSQDKTVEIAKSYKVKFLSDGGEGLSFARRIGVENSSGEYILFFGPDNIMGNGFINNYIELINKWAFDAACVQTRVKNPKNFWDKGLDCRWKLLLGEPGDKNVIGTPGLYRRYCFDNTNFSRKNLGPCDDTELSQRLIKKGYKLGLVPLEVLDQNGWSMKSTWNRFKWYGTGDYYFYGYNSINWNFKRKLLSIFHPLIQTFKYSLKIFFTREVIYCAWMLFVMLARYYGWSSMINKNNIIK